MEKTIKDNKVLLIGIVISIALHGSILYALFSINKEKQIKKQEKKIVYINIVKPKIEKKSQPEVKKKIPKGEKTEKIIKKQPKPKKIKKTKKVEKRKPKPPEKTTKKIVEKKQPEKKTEKPKPEKKPLKSIVEPKEEEIQEIKEDIEKIDISDEDLSPESFSISGLKGKDLIYQHGKKEITQEKKVSEEDILAYIRELERYLNDLARKRDLYPPMAKRLRIEGSLVVRFTIKADGSVDESSIKIVESSSYNILDKGAIKLIKKYVPMFAEKYGKKPPKENLTIELPITFEIIGW